VLRFAALRILLDYRPALRQRTGVGEFAYRLASSLIEVLEPPDRLTLFSSSWKDRLAIGAVPGADVVDRRISVRLLNLAWHRLEWPPVEALCGTSPDVVQSLHPLLLPSRRAARFLTVHDLDFLDHPERTTAEIRRDYPALARRHARRADGVLVPSAHTRDQVASRFGVPAERIVLCQPGAPAWPPRVEPPPGGPILFLGTIEPRKNVPGLVRAYAELLRGTPDAPTLVLAGRAPAAGSPMRLDLEPSLDGRVQQPGYVSDDERQRLYATASMLVLPSFEEGFGFPVLEAMALGLPVIVSNRGSLPELVGDAGLVVDPDDSSTLAHAMHRVLTDAATRRRMREAGIRRARHYTWRASAARVAAAYREAVSRRSRG
jgi:glycosyltransferase involved in cell wall biosynthesis